MKLHSDDSSGLYTVTGYGPGFVAVNRRNYQSSLLLTPKSIEPDWPVASIAALSTELLAPLASRQCDVLLLGTGQRQQFPPSAILRSLIEASGGRMGVEFMDTAAACRTYNILVAEGRNPLAALIVE